MHHSPVFFTVHNGESHCNANSVEMLRTIRTFGTQVIVFNSPEEAKAFGKGRLKIGIFDFQEEACRRFRIMAPSEAGELAVETGAACAVKVSQWCVSRKSRQLKAARQMRNNIRQNVGSTNFTSSGDRPWMSRPRKKEKRASRETHTSSNFLYH